VGYSGFGTEMVEEDVRKLFPDYRITRVDTDAVKKRGSLEKIFEDFKKGEIDILLGTQMVAKGLNFPGVKLVGIVLADTGLHLPDFRAQERTFSLIMQVAGRAGRFFPDGQVIIQTYNPENEAIGMAAEGALEKFYGMELEARKALGFPPWTRLFRIVFRGKKLEVVENAAGIFANRFPDGDDSELLGPAECPLAVISGNYRYQVILRSYRFQVTHRKLSKLLEDISTPSGVYIEVDVDPVSLL
jgi:primosomal protein N' (replication factor Y)